VFGHGGSSNKIAGSGGSGFQKPQSMSQAAGKSGRTRKEKNE
jgi:hypothetical protein